MPRVSTAEDLERAVAGFAVADLDLDMDLDPSALAAARPSLEESGFLLLGEVHGVRENPLVIRSLMRVLGLSGLALEWHADLAPATEGFTAGGRFPDHPLLWSGDGRITAGHLAVLRERAAAGLLSLTLFDETMGADWNWSQHDEAMAGRILAAPVASSGHLGDHGQRAHPHGPHPPRRAARRAPGQAAAGRAGDPDQLRQRAAAGGADHGGGGAEH